MRKRSIRPLSLRTNSASIGRRRRFCWRQTESVRQRRWCQLATTERRHLSFRLVADGRSARFPGPESAAAQNRVLPKPPNSPPRLAGNQGIPYCCVSVRSTLFPTEDGLRQSLHHLQRIGEHSCNLLQAQAHAGDTGQMGLQAPGAIPGRHDVTARVFPHQLEQWAERVIQRPLRIGCRLVDDRFCLSRPTRSLADLIRLSTALPFVAPALPVRGIHRGNRRRLATSLISVSWSVTSVILVAGLSRRLLRKIQPAAGGNR